MKLNFNISEEDRRRISYLASRGSSVKAIIEEFLASGQPVAKIDWQNQYKSSGNAAASIRSVIIHNGYPVRLIERTPDVYIARKEDR